MLAIFNALLLRVSQGRRRVFLAAMDGRHINPNDLLAARLRREILLES
jgi:hypothetical protein